MEHFRELGDSTPSRNGNGQTIMGLPGGGEKSDVESFELDC